MRKLLQTGIRGNLFRWFKSYVEGRCQTVVLNGFSSRAMNIKSGVPQGSLLGPLLFNLFINDVSKCFRHSKILLYADDAKIMKQITGNDDARKLQDDLDSFQNYCHYNKLDLNVSKCYICSYTRRPIPIKYNYKLLDTIISRVESVRDLGVTFDSKLIFDKHINNIITRATKNLGFVYRMSSEFKNILTLKILYCCYVRSHLEYASQIWNPTYKKYINRLESIQMKFMRFIQWRTKCYLPTYSMRCKKIHLLPLSERRKIADLTYLFSVLNGTSDTPELLSKFGLSIPLTSLRKSELLNVPIVNSTYRQSSYIIRVSRSFSLTSQDVDMDIFNDSLSKLRGSLSDRFFSS